MQLTITGVDYAPEELHDQVPIVVDLLRQIPGDDRPDYWIGEVQKPIKWLVDNHFHEVTHVVVAARWEGVSIASGVERVPIAISFVVDPAVLEADHLDFKMCSYVAIGICTETGGGNEPRPSTEIKGGRIGRAFGKGK